MWSLKDRYVLIRRSLPCALVGCFGSSPFIHHTHLDLSRNGPLIEEHSLLAGIVFFCSGFLCCLSSSIVEDLLSYLVLRFLACSSFLLDKHICSMTHACKSCLGPGPMTLCGRHPHTYPVQTSYVFSPLNCSIWFWK